MSREFLSLEGTLTLRVLCQRPSVVEQDRQLMAEQLASIRDKATELRRVKRMFLFGNYPDLDRRTRTELLKYIEPGGPNVAGRIDSLIEALRSRVVGPSAALAVAQDSRLVERARQAQAVIEAAQRLGDLIRIYRQRWGTLPAAPTPYWRRRKL